MRSVRESLAANRANRHTALTDAEKRTQVAVACRIKNYALAEFVMGDPFAGLELSLYFHAPTSGDPQMEQASRLAAFAEQDLLRIFVGLAPQNAAEREQAVAMRCRAAPLNRVGGGMKLDPSET
jgi:hypothetical protein